MKVSPYSSYEFKGDSAIEMRSFGRVIIRVIIKRVFTVRMLLFLSEQRLNRLNLYNLVERNIPIKKSLAGLPNYWTLNYPH